MKGELLEQENIRIIVTASISESSVLKMFSFLSFDTIKREAGIFKFLWFEERFLEKLRFRYGLVWTKDLTREIKLRFQMSSA